MVCGCYYVVGFVPGFIDCLYYCEGILVFCLIFEECIFEECQFLYIDVFEIFFEYGYYRLFQRVS